MYRYTGLFRIIYGMGKIREAFVETFRSGMNERIWNDLKTPKTESSKIIRQAVEGVVGERNVSSSVLIGGVHRDGIVNWTLKKKPKEEGDNSVRKAPKGPVEAYVEKRKQPMRRRRRWPS